MVELVVLESLLAEGKRDIYIFGAACQAGAWGRCLNLKPFTR